MDWPWSPLPFLRRSCSWGRRARRLRLCRLWRRNFGRNLEVKGLNSGVLIVLLRFFDLDLLEISRPLQCSNKVRYGVDGSRRTFHRKIWALARHRGQPQILGARYGVRHHVQQLLAAGAIALQLLDSIDALLQNRLLFFEGFHLQL